MTIFKLRNRETNWGDYGSILVSGMTSHLERRNGLLQLERTGPFIPPLVKSGLWEITVTDEAKQRLLTSGLGGLAFKPVIKKHIVELDWTTWDLQAEDPPFYPDSGEPEDYILAAPHSGTTSDQMGEVWELVIPETGSFQDSELVGYASGVDIFKADNKGYILLTEKAKVWIEQNIGEWVTFERLKLGNSG